MIRAFPNIFSRFGDAKLRELANRTHIDTVSQNTRQELQEALQTAANAGVERLVIVSSPTHVVRALRDVVVMTDQLVCLSCTKSLYTSFILLFIVFIVCIVCIVCIVYIVCMFFFLQGVVSCADS